MIATILALLALVPVGAASMITGDFSQMVYKPTRRSVHFFLKRRLVIIGASVALWLAALLVHLSGSETSVIVLVVTAVLIGLFTLLGYGMSPYVIFPSLREPNWISVEEANEVLPSDGDVIGVEINGDARAYPVDWSFRPHLIEDTVGGEDVIVSYCLLSNLGLVFRAEMEGTAMHCIMPIQWENHMVIYDSAGDRLIQQIDGSVLYGHGTADDLRVYPSQIMPWSAWRDLYPDTKVLDNPPAGPWDRSVRRFIGTRFLEENRRREGPMFPTIESFDERLPTKTEVIGISHAGSHRAYPVADLISTGLVNDDVGGLPIVLVGDPSGAVNVFRRDVDGRVHEFAPSAGGFSDESGHVYDLRGRSPQGSDLDPYPHASRVLWLIWSNFHPETDLAAV